MEETGKISAPAWTRFFGEEGGAQCVELCRDYFMNPPLHGPGAVFVVYDPTKLANVDARLEALANDVRHTMPAGTRCDIRCALATDPDFQRIAQDVLWFDLTTGDAYPPVKRKLGLARPPDAVTRARSQEPVPAAPAAAAVPGPVMTSGGVSLAARFRPPTPDEFPPFYKDPAWWKKTISNVVGLAVVAAILVGGGLYAKKFFDDRAAAEAAAAQAQLEQEQKAAQARAAQLAERKAERERQKAEEARQKAEAAAAKEAGRTGAAAAKRAKEPEPAAKGERAPRSFRELVKQLGATRMERFDATNPPAAFAQRPNGTVYWCVFADNGDEDGRLVRVKTGVSDVAPTAVDEADGKGGMRPKTAGAFVKDAAEKPHLVLMGVDCWLYRPTTTNTPTRYPIPPARMTFKPSVEEFGQPLCDVIRQGSITKRVRHLVTFNFRDAVQPPIEWTVDFDTGMRSSDISRKIRGRLVDAAKAKADAENAKNDAGMAKAAATGKKRPTQTRNGTGDTGDTRFDTNLTSFKNANDSSRNGARRLDGNVDYSGFKGGAAGRRIQTDADDAKDDGTATNGMGTNAEKEDKKSTRAEPDEVTDDQVDRARIQGWLTVEPAPAD